MAKIRISHAQGGFTLLEMVIVVVIMGFLMIGLTEGQRFGFRAWKHQADNIADHDQFDAVDRTLRQLLTQVEMRPATDPSTLSFTGTLPAAVALGTRRADMDLAVDPDHQLILRWVPHRHETPLGNPAKPVTTVLLRNVGKMDIGYFGGGDPNAGGTPNAGGPPNGGAPNGGSAPTPTPSAGSDEASWTDQLNAGDTPKLIKLTFEFPPGDRRHWPAIIVAPAALGPEDQTQPGQAQAAQ
jgi:general secretion pathway protein J